MRHPQHRLDGLAGAGFRRGAVDVGEIVERDHALDREAAGHDVIGEPLLERLLSGSRAHAARRVDEMRAAAAYLEELGVEPRVASASAESLERIRNAR